MILHSQVNLEIQFRRQARAILLFTGAVHSTEMDRFGPTGKVLKKVVRSLLAPFPRSWLLKRRETLATRAMADRESSVALCHGVALKKKERDRSRTESSIALCHGMALKKKGSVEDRQSGVALCHGMALKRKDRSRTERAVSLCATRWR